MRRRNKPGKLKEIAMTHGRLISTSLALAFVAQSALAGDVRMYQAGETPNPQDVANILEAAPATPPIKMRSIRLTKDAESVAARHEAELARQELPSPPAGTPSAFALPVQFGFDSARVLPESLAHLDAVAEGIKLAGPQTRIVIEGHTDAAGSAEYNLNLSRKRAMAVKSYLVRQHGIAPENLRSAGLGKEAPLNEANPFAPENRRVQFRADRGDS
jgi:outer membrane protein OmpA-like peptidoglycan-associated protein